MRNALDVKMTHVPYPSSPQVIQDTVAGRINLTFNIASSALGQIEAKQLIALAVCSNKRSPVLPEVPTRRKPVCPISTPACRSSAPGAGRNAKPVIDTLAATAANKAMHKRRQQVDLLTEEY